MIDSREKRKKEIDSIVSLIFRADFRKSCCFDIQVSSCSTTAFEHSTFRYTHGTAGSQVDELGRLFLGCRSLLGFGSGLFLGGRLRLLGSRRLLGFGGLLGGGFLGCLGL